MGTQSPQYVWNNDTQYLVFKKKENGIMNGIRQNSITNADDKTGMVTDVELQHGHEREGTVMPKDVELQQVLSMSSLSNDDEKHDNKTGNELAIEESTSGIQREGTMVTKGLTVHDDDDGKIKSDEQVMEMIVMSGTNEEKHNSDLNSDD